MFLLLTIIFFGFSLANDPFIFDDYLHIFDNNRVLSNSVSSFIHYFSNSLTPLPFLVWKFIGLFNYGHYPEAYRFFNFILHAANGYLVFQCAFLIFERLQLKDIRFLSWVVALIYLLHPTQVESVVWISSLRGLLASFFALLFLNQGLKRKWNAIIFLILGLLSKPTMISAFLYFFFLLKITRQKASPLFKRIFIIGLLIAPIVIFIHKNNILSTYLNDLPLLLRLKLIVSSTGLYLINVFLPFRLVFDYQMNAFVVSYLEEVNQLGFLITLAPLYLLSMIALMLKERTRIIAYLGLSPFLLLLPHLGFILHDFNNISVVSDRYLNLPLFAFALFITFLLSKLSQIAQRSFTYLPPVSIYAFPIILFASLTLVQTNKWKHPEKLLKSSQIFTELRVPILQGLANMKVNKGDFKNARVYLKQALSLDTQNPELLSRLIKLARLAPQEREDQFLLDYIKNQSFQLNSQLYLPFARLYLKYSLTERAHELTNKAILEKVDLRDAYILKNRIERFEEDNLAESFLKLELYYGLKKEAKKALKYNKLYLSLKPGDIEAESRQGNYLELENGN